MHENTYLLVNKAIHETKLQGKDKSCENNPCHENLEDCTFCYCPFYPCYDEALGGSIVKNQITGKLIWFCANCILPHIKEYAQFILDKLILLNKDLEDISDLELKNIRFDLLNEFVK